MFFIPLFLLFCLTFDACSDVLKESLDVPVSSAFDYKAHAVALSVAAPVAEAARSRRDSADDHENADE